MAIPVGLVETHRTTQENLVRAAQRTLTTTFRSVATRDAASTTAALLDGVRPIVDTFGDLSAIGAADFYDSARAASNPRGSYRALAGSLAPPDQVEAMVRWAVAPLWADNPRPDAALSRLTGGVARLVQQPGRETIWAATQEDPARPRFARVPYGPNPCAFCLMLASRGGVYRDEDTATTAQSGGRAGMAYHDDCWCRPHPVWEPDDLPDVNRRLADEWDQVTAGRSDQLQAWREHIAADA